MAYTPEFTEWGYFSPIIKNPSMRPRLIASENRAIAEGLNDIVSHFTINVNPPYISPLTEYELPYHSFTSYNFNSSAIRGVEVVRYIWDETKRLANLEKHGLDFIDAQHVLEGPTIAAEDRKGEYAEQRFLAFGFRREHIVAISYTYEVEDAIRIISMRKATRYEREKFLEHLLH